MTKENRVGGLAFAGGDMDKCWADAERFAGAGGRVATLPDIIDARLAVEPSVNNHSTAWDRYITTTSAEYAGLSKGGTPILIVAHNVGPLATREGAMAVYRNAKSRHGGGDNAFAESGCRIPRSDFLKLEAGDYGDVAVVDLDAFQKRYDYPFMTPLSMDDCLDEPLVAARMGPRWNEYLTKHEDFARGAWAKDKGVRLDDSYAGIILGLDQPDPHYVLGCSDPSRSAHKRLGFNHTGLEAYPAIGGADPSEAFANLLVISQLTNMNYAEYRQTMLVTEIDIHGGSHHCRFLGLRKDANLANIAHDIGARGILHKHWRDLLVPAKGTPAPIRRIETIQPGAFFTMTLKEGHNMDSGVFEHPVRSAKQLGPGEFVTTIDGYFGFLRYDLNEVLAVAPPGANAYVLGDGQIEDGATKHRVPVVFYHADIDLDHRLTTVDELENDFDLLMKFAAPGDDA